MVSGAGSLPPFEFSPSLPESCALPPLQPRKIHPRNRQVKAKHFVAMNSSSMGRLRLPKSLPLRIGRSRHNPRQIFAQYRRAPVLFDMLDDHFRAARVTHKWRLPGIVHGIGQVAAEHNILAEADLLADAEWPTQDAHVGVHSHEHDVLDAFLRTQVVDLLPTVADAVVADDIERLVLPAESPHRLA